MHTDCRTQEFSPESPCVPAVEHGCTDGRRRQRHQARVGRASVPRCLAEPIERLDERRDEQTSVTARRSREAGLGRLLGASGWRRVASGDRPIKVDPHQGVAGAMLRGIVLTTALGLAALAFTHPWAAEAVESPAELGVTQSFQPSTRTSVVALSVTRH